MQFFPVHLCVCSFVLIMFIVSQIKLHLRVRSSMRKWNVHSRHDYSSTQHDLMFERIGQFFSRPFDVCLFECVLIMFIVGQIKLDYWSTLFLWLFIVLFVCLFVFVRVRDCGMNFEWNLFQFTSRDCLLLSKVSRTVFHTNLPLSAPA